MTLTDQLKPFLVSAGFELVEPSEDQFAEPYWVLDNVEVCLDCFGGVSIHVLDPADGGLRRMLGLPPEGWPPAAVAEIIRAVVAWRAS